MLDLVPVGAGAPPAYAWHPGRTLTATSTVAKVPCARVTKRSCGCEEEEKADLYLSDVRARDIRDSSHLSDRARPDTCSWLDRFPHRVGNHLSDLRAAFGLGFCPFSKLLMDCRIDRPVVRPPAPRGRYAIQPSQSLQLLKSR